MIWQDLLPYGLLAGVFALIELGLKGIGALIKRKWSKADKTDEKWNDLLKTVSETKELVLSHIKEDEEYKAKAMRARILQFNEEIREGRKHTEEHFIDILETIDAYEDYCKEHPEFVNNRAGVAVDNIKETFRKANKDNDFI